MTVSVIEQKLRISPSYVQHELKHLIIFQEDELQTFYGNVLEVNQCTDIEELSKETSRKQGI